MRRLAPILMAASGFAALGYQVVWTQQGALWLGHEAAAVLAVLAAFFGGLALGAIALGGRIEASPAPALWYAACEITIGVWGLALAFLMQPAATALLAIVGAEPTPLWQWSVAFAATFLLLLPATAAMGATLPAMERVLAQWRADARAIPKLYAANTVGAVLGVVATAFWLVPGFGLAWTALVCATLNFGAAAAAVIAAQPAPRSPLRHGGESGALLGTLAVTGFLGIGYEVLAVRVVSQVTENTIYTFAILLAIYLAGTALGAAMCARAAAGDARRRRDRLLALLALASVGGAFTMSAAPALHAALRSIAPNGAAGGIAAEAALAIAAFLPPTIAMGAVFSHLAAEARERGTRFASAIAANTLGAATAPFAFGVALVPHIGAKLSLAAIALGYIALCTRGAWRRPVPALAVAALVLLVAAPVSLAIVDVPAGGQVVSRVEGALAAVSVVEDSHGVARLHINNRQQEGSSATLFADARQALVPLLLHPSPRRVLFLGMGTGATSYSAAQDPSLEVEVVELLPEVIDASRRFTRAIGDREPRVIAADARRFLRASPARYDVIVSDNFHPARSGSASLYTVEHFAAARARLAPGGIFCQWLPLHQLDLDTLRAIVKSFLHVNPRALALLATNSLETPVVGLLAQREEAAFDLSGVRERLAGARFARPLGWFGLDDELAVVGSFIAGPRALESFAADASLNTDDRPVVAYLAPRITYAPDSAPRDRLLALVHETSITPGEVLAPGDAASARLSGYWAARDAFLAAGRVVTPTPDVRRMLAQVRGPLLEVLHTSPEFRPAYDPLLRMALALASTDARASRELLSELARAQPRRPEAIEALRELAPGS